MSWSELELGRDSGFLNRVLASRQNPVLNVKLNLEMPFQRLPFEKPGNGPQRAGKPAIHAGDTRSMSPKHRNILR